MPRRYRRLPSWGSVLFQKCDFPQKSLNSSFSFWVWLQTISNFDPWEKRRPEMMMMMKKLCIGLRNLKPFCRFQCQIHITSLSCLSASDTKLILGFTVNIWQWFVFVATNIFPYISGLNLEQNLFRRASIHLNEINITCCQQALIFLESVTEIFPTH